MKRSDICFFFQLPKTAGGTLARSIQNNPRLTLLTQKDYAAALRLPEPRSGEPVFWMNGHNTFGLHALHGAQANYVTILREPMDRLISDFFYHHAHLEPQFHIPESERLPAFIRMVEAHPHLNYCCFMYSAYCYDKERYFNRPGDTLDEPFALLRRRHNNHHFIPEKTPYARIDPNRSYRAARKNLRSLYSLIGFYERLDATAEQIKKRFDLDFDLKPRVHVTTMRPAVTDLPGPVQAMLRDKTEADRALYAEFDRRPQQRRFSIARLLKRSR